MPNETIKLIPVSEEMKKAFLDQGKLLRRFSQLIDDEVLREISYQQANDWQRFVDEMWESGFTLEDIECSMTQ